MKRLLIIGLLALLSACHTTPRLATDHLVALQDNVVTLQMDTGGVCSGWINAKSHKIVTAAHCFGFDNGAHQALVHFNDGTTDIWKTDFVSTDVLEDTKDFATLVPEQKYDFTKKPGLSTCQFKPYYGEFVSFMGAPIGISKSMTFGYIQRPDVDGLIAVDAKMLPGNSGGPLIDVEEGCVIGSAEEVQLYPVGSPIPYGVNFAIPVTEF